MPSSPEQSSQPLSIPLDDGHTTSDSAPFDLEALKSYSGPINASAYDSSVEPVACLLYLDTVKPVRKIGKDLIVQERRTEALRLGSSAIGKPFLMTAPTASRRLFFTTFTTQLNLLEQTLTNLERFPLAKFDSRSPSFGYRVEKPNYTQLLRSLWDVRNVAEDSFRLAGNRIPLIPSWANDADILEVYSENDLEILSVSFRAEVENFLVLLDKTFDFLKNEPRDSILVDAAASLAKPKVTIAAQSSLPAKPSPSRASPTVNPGPFKYSIYHSTGVREKPNQHLYPGTSKGFDHVNVSTPVIMTSRVQPYSSNARTTSAKISRTAHYGDLGNPAFSSNVHSLPRAANQYTHHAEHLPRSSHNYHPHHPRDSQFGHSAVPQHYLHQNLKGALFAPIGPVVHAQPSSRFTRDEFYSDSSDSDGFNSEHEGTSQDVLGAESEVYESHGSVSDSDSAFETHSVGEHDQSDSESTL